MNNAVTPEAAWLLWRSQGVDSSVLDQLTTNQLHGLFDVVVVDRFPTGLSFVDVGCAKASTAGLLIAVVEQCRDWDELVAASVVLVHDNLAPEVTDAMVEAFRQLVPATPTRAQYLSISLLISLVVATDHLPLEKMLPFTEHSPEVAAMTREIQNAWGALQETEPNTHHVERDRLLEDLSRMAASELQEIYHARSRSGDERAKVIALLVGNPQCPVEVLEQIAGEANTSLSELMAVADHPACTPVVFDAVLTTLGRLFATDPPSHATLVSTLRTLHRSEALTDDHVQRVRRWSPETATVWDIDVDRRARHLKAARDVLDLPVWLQPNVAGLLSQELCVTTAEAVALLARFN